MSLGEALQQLATDHIQWAVIVTILALGVLDFVLGVLRAWADKAAPPVKLEYLDVWVRTQLAGRIVPIILVLIFAALAPPVTIGDFSLQPLAVAGNIAAAAYALSTSKSIIDSLNPSTPDKTPTE